MAQLVEHLASKHKVLSSDPNTTHTQEKRKNRSGLCPQAKGSTALKGQMSTWLR
jgi:hypothetical protein